MDLGAIHSELDHLSLRTLELSQELVSAKLRLENVMKEGFFLLAKARYSIGVRGVSAMQLPSGKEPFKANVKITSDECVRTDSGVRFSYCKIAKDDQEVRWDTSLAHSRKIQLSFFHSLRRRKKDSVTE